MSGDFEVYRDECHRWLKEGEEMILPGGREIAEILASFSKFSVKDLLLIGGVECFVKLFVMQASIVQTLKEIRSSLQTVLSDLDQKEEEVRGAFDDEDVGLDTEIERRFRVIKNSLETSIRRIDLVLES